MFFPIFFLFFFNWQLEIAAAKNKMLKTFKVFSVARSMAI